MANNDSQTVIDSGRRELFATAGALTFAAMASPGDHSSER